MSEDSPREKENQDREGERTTSDPDLLEFLSSAYEVLRKIFSYLNLDDLQNAALAYEPWKPVAEVTKRERTALESFFLSDKKYGMSPIWSEAVFCIRFRTARNPETEAPTTRHVHPTEGRTVSCLARNGVVGTLHDLSQIMQQKLRLGLPLAPEKFYLACLRIPKIPDVGIRTCFWEEKDDFESFKRNLDLPEGEIVKCLLILMVAEESTRTAWSHTDEFIRFLRERQKCGFAIGGSIVDDFEHEGGIKNPDDSRVKYVLFYGKNVEAASTVLTSDVKSRGGIEEKVSQLKRRCSDPKKGALFVFRCTGRQRVVRRNRLKNDIVKWEGDTFSKYFPDSPVVGCYGYGEFGNEHPADENDVVRPNKRFRGNETSETWEFSFSTSLVYLVFKK